MGATTDTENVQKINLHYNKTKIQKQKTKYDWLKHHTIIGEKQPYNIYTQFKLIKVHNHKKKMNNHDIHNVKSWSKWGMKTSGWKNTKK